MFSPCNINSYQNNNAIILVFFCIFAALGCTITTHDNNNNSSTDSATDSATNMLDTTSTVETDSITDSAQDDTATTVSSCSESAQNGSCSQDKVVYCENNTVNQLDCGQVGERCEITEEYADCAPVERFTGCGELTPHGDCIGNDIQWCDEDKIIAVPIQFNCEIYGRQCDPTGGEDGGADCVPHGECQGVDENGVCEGNVLSFCENDALFVFDCGTNECRSLSGLADCFTAGALTNCGTETIAGRCDGNELIKCEGGTVTREDCGVLGMECAPGTIAQCQRDVGCESLNCAAGYVCQDNMCSGPPTEPREWTIAVYMVGDNNLSNAVWQDLNEMEAANMGTEIKVVTEFELSNQYTSLAPEQYRSGAYRMAIEGDNDINKVTSLAQATALGEVDMTSSQHVADFARWAAEQYPSKKFAFIFWDHGFGWRGGFVDSRSNSVMSLRDIVDGMRESGTNPNLIAFDACMMGMHEVAMALRGITDTLVASEEAVPGGGYPYDSVFQHLSEQPTMTAVELGSVIASDYTNQFSDGLRARSVTLSVLDLSMAEATNQALASFSESFIADLPGRRGEVRDAVRSQDVLRYREKDSADLRSTLSVFEALGGNMGTAATSFLSWFDSSNFVLDSKATLNVAASFGIAIHLPANAFSLYNSQSFEDYRDSTQFLPLEPWHSVIANLTETTSAGQVLGIDNFTVELEWADSIDGTQSNLDLDLIIIEPNGVEAAALNGSVTSNGLLSADSADAKIPRESYQLRDGHQSGTYVILVELYSSDAIQPSTEQAYPRVTISLGDNDAFSRYRGYTQDRAIIQVPMDYTNPFEGKVTNANIQPILDHEFSTLWYVATLQVE